MAVPSWKPYHRPSEQCVGCLAAGVTCCISAAVTVGWCPARGSVCVTTPGAKVWAAPEVLANEAGDRQTDGHLELSMLGALMEGLWDLTAQGSRRPGLGKVGAER